MENVKFSAFDLGYEFAKHEEASVKDYGLVVLERGINLEPAKDDAAGQAIVQQIRDGFAKAYAETRGKTIWLKIDGADTIVGRSYTKPRGKGWYELSVQHAMSLSRADLTHMRTKEKRLNLLNEIQAVRNSVSTRCSVYMSRLIDRVNEARAFRDGQSASKRARGAGKNFETTCAAAFKAMLSKAKAEGLEAEFKSAAVAFFQTLEKNMRPAKPAKPAE